MEGVGEEEGEEEGWRTRWRRRRGGGGGGGGEKEEEEEEEKEFPVNCGGIVFTFISMTQKVRQFYSLIQVVQNTVILLEYRDLRNFRFLNVSGINFI